MERTPVSRSAVERHGSGFTVLESLVVVCILAILLLQGVPTLRDYTMRQRMSAAMHLLHSHLSLARNDAVRFNVEIVACPGTKPNGCRADSRWEEGWLVFEDLNGDRGYQAGERLLAAEPGMDNLMIRGSASRRYLRFAPNGSAPGSNTSISFCDLRGPRAARKLVISNTGRIRRESMPDISADSCPAESTS